MRDSPWQQCHDTWNRFHLLISKRDFNFPVQEINKLILTFMNMKSYTFSGWCNKLHNREDTIRVITLNFVKILTASDVQFLTRVGWDYNWFLPKLFHLLLRSIYLLFSCYRLRLGACWAENWPCFCKSRSQP